MPASNARIEGNLGSKPEDVKARQDKFLEAYARHGTIKAAAKEVGISRETVNQWTRHDINDFVKRRSDAKEDFTEEVEYTFYQRALDPASNPVIGIFILKALKPGVYRDQVVITEEVAKDVMQDIRSKFRGIKFDNTADEETKTAEQQVEEILRGKRNDS